jgi:cytidylate kinase
MNLPVARDDVEVGDMTGVLKLIDRQAAMWGIKDRLGNVPQRPGRLFQDGVAYGPCLLVSRECASGGGLIARQAGGRLGWDVYDGEIVEEIARVEHERRRLVESVDERSRSRWEQTWQQVLTAAQPADATYLHGLRQVVMSLGHHGDAVIVGRGAQHLLPSGCAVRVRVIAPLGQRAARMAEHDHIPEAEARAKIREIDAARAAFIWRTFKQHTESPLNYDLVINTAETGIQAAADIVLAAISAKLGVGPRLPHLPGAP